MFVSCESKVSVRMFVNVRLSVYMPMCACCCTFVEVCVLLCSHICTGICALGSVQVQLEAEWPCLREVSDLCRVVPGLGLMILQQELLCG